MGAPRSGTRPLSVNSTPSGPSRRTRADDTTGDPEVRPVTSGLPAPQGSEGTSGWARQSMPTASTGWTELPVRPVTVRVQSAGGAGPGGRPAGGAGPEVHPPEPPGAPGPGSARVTACTMGTAAATPGVLCTVAT